MAVSTNAETDAASSNSEITVVLVRPAMYEGKRWLAGSALTVPEKAAATWVKNGTARISRSRLAKSAAAAAGGAA